MIVEEFLREAGIARGDLMRVVRALLEYSDAWQVAGRANVPFAELVDILQRLDGRRLLHYQDSQLRLTSAGEALAHSLKVAPARDPTCHVCGGSGVEFDQFAEARSEFEPLIAGRPPAISSYDQGALTADSVFERLAWMYGQGDVAQKKLLLLGDDDLLSLALALTGLPREIVVVEIDVRLCDFIRKVARLKHLPITVIPHDSREKLPPDLHAAFDTFVTDPTETIQGLLLFVEKGLSTLLPGGAHAGYFGVTLIEASLHKWNLWERHLLQNHALVFTQISPPFSLYGKGTEQTSVPKIDFAPLSHPPLKPWYRSAFFRVETLGEFVPPPDYETNPRDELYQDAESLDEAWAVLKRGAAKSPTPIPDEFLRESAERAAVALQGLGRHVIAEFWNCANGAPLQGLDLAIEEAVRAARATLLDLQIRKFYPQGFSAIALLAESHLSLHAWPELGYVALDAFTCGQADPQKIVSSLEEHFHPCDTAYLKIPRGRARDVITSETTRGGIRT
jgi:S-adenosylmethionine decarboxylase proenzyme